MGIINVTPDSFSDGGQFADVAQAVRHGRELVDQGADILDIGGESTRPGAVLVGTEQETARVVPVISELARQCSVSISVDTTKAAVAEAALAAGAHIVNDISGLTFDPKMADVCRRYDAGVVCMHMQGTPQTMQDAPTYTDVVVEVCRWLEDRLQALESQGILRERIVLDPGIGFGKTAEHNLELLSHLHRIRALGRPVLVGHSRKRFLAHVLGRPVDERVYGTLGIAAALAAQSTDIIRVHDVRATRDVLMAWHAVMSRVEQHPED
jgi:dihydropteroate synthase